MAATVSNGLTNITLANNNTGFGVWKRDGTGGTPSAISETDVFLQGTGSCSVKVSNQGVVLAYNISAGVDLSATDTHVYIWVNMLAGGLMANRASNGLCIFLSSDTTLSSGSNYSMWAVDGADTYPGGWVRYVIDVSKTRTAGAGTLSLSSVRHIGMYCDTRPNTAKFDNLVIDRIDYAVAGTGLAAYGTSTTDDTFGDILSADEGTVNNKYGVVTSKEGVIYVRGTIELGDDTGTNAATLTDIDKVIVFETPQYYNGTAVVNCTSDNFNNLKIVGNGTGATSVTLGKKVGTGDTASGRNGITLIESGSPVTVSFDDGNADTVKVYGSSLIGITGSITWGDTTTHECIGNSFSASSQFDPGGVIVRACNLINTVDTEAALLWKNNINIKNSNFIANTAGAGIEHGNPLFDEYPNSNYSGSSAGIFGASFTAYGQSFLSEGGKLAKVYFHLQKTGSPTGNAVAKLYAHSGTFGTSSVPTGAALATSDNLDVSTLTGTFTDTELNFSTPYEMTAGTHYVVVFEFTGGDGSNYVNIAYDTSTPTHAGNSCDYISAAWTSNAHDVIFGVTVLNTFEYQGLNFSGNTNDILYSAPANTGELTINATDSNPSTSEITNATGNSVSIVNSVNVTINVVDEGGTAITDARVRLEAASGGALPATASVTITSSGTTATVTHTAHGLSTGDYVIIRGAVEDEYNGDYQVTVSDANTYTYTLPSSTTSPATGTITASARIMNELTVTGGVATEVFNYSADQPIRGVVRKSSASPYYKQGTVTGTITSGGFTTTVTMVSDE